MLTYDCSSINCCPTSVKSKAKFKMGHVEPEQLEEVANRFTL